MKDKLLIISILSALTLLFTECRKNSTNPECTISGIVPFEPYSNPIWHPNGQLLGFNHTPLVSISASGSAPCTWYYYGANRDSAGFYLMNKDGSGFRRVMDFRLLAPSWSPDGKWLAFSLGSNIYKMPFDGNTFDTSKIVRLTTIGGNFFPSWTANNDTIYYDSSNDTPEGTIFYSIWKMKSDGVGKTRLTQSAGIGETRQPFVGSNDKVYYFGYVSGVGYVPGQTEIFAMNKDGSNQTQITFNGHMETDILQNFGREICFTMIMVL